MENTIWIELDDNRAQELEGRSVQAKVRGESHVGELEVMKSPRGPYSVRLVLTSGFGSRVSYEPIPLDKVEVERIVPHPKAGEAGAPDLILR